MMRADLGRMRVVTAIFLMTLAGSVQGQPRLLYPLERAGAAIEQTAFEVEEERRVREVVFGAHVESYVDCPGSGEPAYGDTAIVDRAAPPAKGAFTSRGSAQTAYFYRVQPCSPSGRYYSGRVLLVEDGLVVHDFDGQADAFLRAAAVDLNGDGLDELVHVGGYLGMGQWSQSLWLTSLEGGEWTTLIVQDVGGDTCGAGTTSSPGVVVDVRVMYEPVPGAWPRFSVTRELSPCEDEPADLGLPFWWEGELAEALEIHPTQPQAAALTILRLARRGYPSAQLEAGRMYARGLGLPRDVQLAEMWLQEAADAGEEEAREILRTIR